MRSVSDADPREEHVSDLVLDEWLTDELLPEARARVDEHLARCEACRSKRALFEAEHAAFLAEAPSLQKSAPARSREAESTRVFRPWRLAAASAVAIAATALLMLRTDPGTEPGVERPTTRLKGGPSVSFFIKHGARVTRGSSGATVMPGDALRFTYSVERPLHLALLGSDEQSASVYYPSGTHAQRVEPGRDVALDFSIELDDRLGKEQVHVVFCREPIELEPLRAELADKRTLSAPTGCTLQQIELHKVASQ